MGFLDAIFPGSDSGGLLDFLKRNAMNQQFPSGLASDTAQYGGTPSAAAAPAAYRPGMVQSAPLAAQPQQPAPQMPIAQPGMPAPMQQPAPAAAPDPLASMMPPPGGQQHGFFGQLAAGLSSIAHGGTLAGLAMGQPDDPQSIAQRQQQQTIRMQYNALRAAGIPQDKALLAAINPEAGKLILGNAFGPHSYQFAQLPDGTIVRQDPSSGAVAPAYQGAPKADFGIVGEQDGSKTYGFIDKNKRTVQPLDAGDDRGGTITGPDGKPIQIPPGVDRSTFIKEISKTNADAATGKLTESQAKSSTYAARMELAESNLKNLQNQGTGYWGRMMTGLPVVGGSAATNWATPGDYQKYTQSRDNFIAALLRQESGAAIGKSEYEAADKQYFPQPGDTADVIRQKAETRKVAIEQMKRAAGPGYKSPTTGAGAADPLGIR